MGLDNIFCRQIFTLGPDVILSAKHTKGSAPLMPPQHNQCTIKTEQIK